MSIVMGIVQGFIGTAGMKILEFYTNNSLWINGIILFYALIIFVAWKNYRTVYFFLLENLTEQMAPKAKTWSKSEVTKNMRNVEIPWNAACKKAVIPLIAKTDYFIPSFVSEEVIKKLFPQDFLIKIVQEGNKE